ncbi:glycoside hydrolase family 76 protein [Trematosphaeria pertusa]|uniref:mannan endo-1,6-alpha-mannosidase n=1 Tax=Trematosphaeria pertusa TaxID=390896 RepID=A0A6A6ICX2_9PLEO|nr:glycoside hydrolase family 76 protein [Trematosphaeria pertusa]KAF2247343.1 glycoside hydrolase family 76 protein [Trematosphaeria pertusa]
MAQAVKAVYPNQNLALLPQPYWWWESGSTVDALLTYAEATGDKQYETLLSSTIMNQATGTNDFMTPDATGNDDQAWWALAALTAAENDVPVPSGGVPWLTLAQNVFNQQKARWDTTRCNGGMKWKINVGDGTDGYHYKSSIANGLFFQLAARLAKLSNDADALSWAEKAYDWVTSVGLIDGEFNVFDGTDDAKGENGCVDVNHDQWSYNVGVFLHGSAVLAAHTSDAKWLDRTKGFVASTQRTFVRDGALFEEKCEGDGSCNTDQVSFKGTLARWLGGTAVVLPELKVQIANLMGANAAKVQGGWSAGLAAMDQFTGLEVVDAAVRARGEQRVAEEGMIGMSRSGKREVEKRGRSVAGRVWWEA